MELTVPYDGAPTIYKNMLLIGTNFYGPGERHIAPQLDQAVGQIPESHGYDVRTGKELWTFHTFPKPGEIGHDTWGKNFEGNDSSQNRTGNNVWAFALTVDEEHGIVYEPVSGPGANYYGGDRPGANLFGNTPVALDVETGKMKWYFQNVRHELWDYNLPPAPGLIDIVKDGKKIQALAQVGKSGYMYILDRVTGKPVFGVVETPVAKSDVPGEVSFPTQPIPVKPPPISRVSFTQATTSSPRPTPRRSTPKPARICGTASGACTTAARSLRSRFTPRTPNPASSSPAPPAARIGEARPPIPSSATFSSIRTTARWWVGWRRIRSTRPATKRASSRTRTPARKGSADSTRRCATPTAA